MYTLNKKTHCRLTAPQVDAANVIAKVARSLELQERWDEAFNKYLLAIEGAMRVLSLENDRKSERGAKLRSQVSKWMSSAEKIKVGCLLFEGANSI